MQSAKRPASAPEFIIRLYRVVAQLLYHFRFYGVELGEGDTEESRNS